MGAPATRGALGGATLAGPPPPGRAQKGDSEGTERTNRLIISRMSAVWITAGHCIAPGAVSVSVSSLAAAKTVLEKAVPGGGEALRSSRYPWS